MLEMNEFSMTAETRLGSLELTYDEDESVLEVRTNVSGVIREEDYSDVSIIVWHRLQESIENQYDADLATFDFTLESMPDLLQEIEEELELELD